MYLNSESARSDSACGLTHPPYFGRDKCFYKSVRKNRVATLLYDTPDVVYGLRGHHETWRTGRKLGTLPLYYLEYRGVKRLVLVHRWSI